jgi:hypothetical protein
MADDQPADGGCGHQAHVQRRLQPPELCGQQAAESLGKSGNDLIGLLAAGTVIALLGEADTIKAPTRPAVVGSGRRS